MLFRGFGLISAFLFACTYAAASQRNEQPHVQVPQYQSTIVPRTQMIFFVQTNISSTKAYAYFEPKSGGKNMRAQIISNEHADDIWRDVIVKVPEINDVSARFCMKNKTKNSRDTVCSDFLPVSKAYFAVGASRLLNTTRTVVDFPIPSRYKVVAWLDEGTSAKVWLAYDRETGKKLALKVNRKPEGLQHEKTMLSAMYGDPANEDYEETVLLHVVRPIAYFENGIAFPYMPLSLHQLIQRRHKHLKNPDASCFSLKELQVVAHLVLYGLTEIHKFDIVHGDIKPNNLMFSDPNFLSSLVIIDFSNSHDVTIKRRAVGGTWKFDHPTIKFMGRRSLKDDVWSLGMVLLNMILGKPLIPESAKPDLARHKYGKLIEQYLLLLGRPPDPNFNNPRGPRGYDYFDALPDYRILFDKFPGVERISNPTWMQRLEPGPFKDLFVDFIDKCLRWERSEIWSASELLRHPFIVSEIEI